MRRKIKVLGYAVMMVLILALTFQCNTHKPTINVTNPHPFKWLNLSDSAHYVGMATCAKCHDTVLQSFSHTGMGMSFGNADINKSVADFNKHTIVYDKFSDLSYQPFLKDGLVYLKEFRIQGRDTIYKREEKIDYIIGSGHHTNSHIVNENGYLYQAPLTWYVQQHIWDLPPGFEGGYNSRFSRELGAECLTCHNGYPKFVEGSINKYTSIPLGIDCERCHGPGSIHVQTKESGKIVDITKDTDFTIVNPRKLPYKLQIDICQRCHLQGDAVLKPGKTFFDFRPGMALTSVMDEFLPTFSSDDRGFLMASHAERLRKSRCFLESQDSANPQKFNCITCHNPHISVKFTQMQVFINKCMSCHSTVHQCTEKLAVREKKDNNCITCHMPKSSAVDIPHVSITDHYIRVVKNKPPDAASVPKGRFTGLACLTDNHPSNLTIAEAYLYYYEKFEKQGQMLDSAFVYLNKYPWQQAAADYIHFYYLKEDYMAAADLAARYKGPFATALTNYQVGQSYINLNNFSSALTYLQQAVALQPYNLEYRIKLGTCFAFLGNFSKSQQEFEFVLQENNKRSDGWNSLGFLQLVQYNFTGAEKAFRHALALDPDYEPAHVNMAKVFAYGDKDYKKAELEIDTILKHNPKDRDAIILKDSIMALQRRKL